MPRLPAPDPAPVSAPADVVPALAPGAPVRVWEHNQSLDGRVQTVHEGGLLDIVIERPATNPLTLAGVHPRAGQGNGYELL